MPGCGRSRTGGYRRSGPGVAAIADGRPRTRPPARASGGGERHAVGDATGWMRTAPHQHDFDET
ncbi:MAG: hypothetical protein ABEH90_06200 [Halolamina sp.]